MKGHLFAPSLWMIKPAPVTTSSSLIFHHSQEPVCLFLPCLLGLPVVPSWSSPHPSQGTSELQKPRFYALEQSLLFAVAGAEPSAEVSLELTLPGGFVWASVCPPPKTLDIFKSTQIEHYQKKWKRHTSLTGVINLLHFGWSETIMPGSKWSSTH